MVPKIKIRHAMIVHASISMIISIFTILLPHAIFVQTESGYNHMAHEYLRLYGCLTIAIGWFIWSIQNIKDGRVIKALSETFAICYLLHGLIMLRAQFSNPAGHSVLHWLLSLCFFVIGMCYGYVRLFFEKRDFELPGVE